MIVVVNNKGEAFWLIFNSMSTCLELLYAKWLGNCVYCKFIFTFLCSCLRGYDIDYSLIIIYSFYTVIWF